MRPNSKLLLRFKEKVEEQTLRKKHWEKKIDKERLRKSNWEKAKDRQSEAKTNDTNI